MTWTELTDRVLVPFESQRGQLDTRVGKYLDEAMEDFSLYSKTYVRKFNIFISAGKTYVDLPNDFVEMKDAPVFRGEILTNRTSNSYLYNQDTNTNRFNQGSPCEYYIEDRRFHLVPRPSQKGILTIPYVAIPTSLRGMTGLKKLRFDNLQSEYFKVGNKINSRVGASDTTNTIATIERADHHTALEGILTISNITNGFLTDNEDFFSTSAETTYYQNLYGTNWSSLTTTWNALGFGGTAEVNGNQFDYTEDKPIISDVYHYLLVDYAKAMIHQDLGNGDSFNNHYTLYLANREKARTISANRGIGGVSYVADRLSPGTY